MIDFANNGGDEGLNWGIPLVAGPFQRLTDPQKYAVLEEVVKALIEPTVTVPVLTAINEGAIFYVFEFLREQFDDVEMGEDVWGELVLDAYRETSDPDDMDGDDEGSGGGICHPTIGCLDKGKWEFALECIADAILWDRDWEMEEELEHGRHSALMQMIDIDPAYFAPFKADAYNVRGAKERLYAYLTRYLLAR